MLTNTVIPSVPKVWETNEVVAVAKTIAGELLVSKQVRGTDAVDNILIAFPDIQPAQIKCCYLFVRSADGSKANKSMYVSFAGAHSRI
jgi:hypothetical protein